MAITPELVASSIDMFAMSFVLGATAWFFLVQSPVLFKVMGRERFLPLQMRLAVLFFNTMTVGLAVMLVATIAHTRSLLAWPTVTAAWAFAAVCIDKVIVLPRALKAGASSRSKGEGHGEASALADFASEGGGSSTKVLHRLVVLFAVLMMVGLVAHALTLVAASSHS